MRPETDVLVRELLGKALWTCRRAADIATFQFGRRIQVKDYYGRESESGEYAMHIQCSWRIVRGGSVIVGSGDLYYPADTEDDSVPENFDWERDPNRRDNLLQSLFNDGSLTVSDVHVGTAGTCRFEFEEDTSLEIFPNDSLPHEHWRLFATQGVGREVVITGGQHGQ